MSRSLISIDDLTEKEILKILAKIAYFKKKRKLLNTGEISVFYLKNFLLEQDYLLSLLLQN